MQTTACSLFSGNKLKQMIQYQKKGEMCHSCCYEMYNYSFFWIDIQSPVSGDVCWLHLWQSAGHVAGYSSAAPGASVWGWLRTKHSQDAAKSCSSVNRDNSEGIFQSGQRHTSHAEGSRTHTHKEPHLQFLLYRTMSWGLWMLTIIKKHSLFLLNAVGKLPLGKKMEITSETWAETQ